MPGHPASPQEQMWMARSLDALDAALNATASATPPAEGEPAGEQQPAAPAPGSASLAEQAAQAAAAARSQAAMAAAAQAAAARMRSARAGNESEKPGDVPGSKATAKSTAGAKIDGEHVAYGKTADAKNLKTGEWGKLPKKVAEELNQGQRENVAGEYRTQVETYYRVIAEKSKK